MTLKVIHGRADSVHPSPFSETAVPKAAKEATPQERSLSVTNTRHIMQSDAVVTAVRSTGRMHLAGERIASPDNAKEVAKKVADKIRAGLDGEVEAHTALERNAMGEAARRPLLS
jgi:hypothetical protein